MERDIVKQLEAWKAAPSRKPLVLKGARQVGKTWALKRFGEQCYEHVAYFSLENIAPGIPSEYAEIFNQTRDASRIVANLSFASGVPIEPGRTLIILDEIQDCPAAIGALKSFCEQAPEHHVVCAGSLLGVALAREGSSFPVGKVTFREMRPCTFSEFLRAVGLGRLDEYCRSIDGFDAVPNLFASQLEEQLQRYFAVGGMPEAVDTWARTQHMDEVDQVLSDLLDSYDRDFSKHGGASLYAKLSLVWRSLPAQLARENKKFLYGLVRDGARAREYEDAITWLANAGLVRKIVRSTGPAVPLSARDEANAFKLYCLDVGLLRRLARVDARAFARKEDMFSQFRGAFAENYAAMALNGVLDSELRYWTWDKPRHEVDFLAQCSGCVVPIEVKSGERVRSASLSYYRKKYPDDTPLALRLSMRNLGFEGGALSVPLFLADHAPRFVRLALSES